MQKNQDTASKVEKYKMNIVRFLAVGGVSAVVGLIATSPELATNITAQNIGMYAALISALGMGGAFWNWASLEDMKEGRNLATEFSDVKQGFSNVISRMRKEFDDEFATNQGLDNNEPVTAKKKIGLK